VTIDDKWKKLFCSEKELKMEVKKDRFIVKEI